MIENDTPQTAGAALAPLSTLQRQELARLARRAFDRLCTRGELGDTAEFDAWRHEQAMQVVERPGLRLCRNEDYLLLRAHFMRILGHEEQAGRMEARAAMEPRSWAIARLRAECRQAADVLPKAWDYATGFIRNKRKVSIEDADERTIWHAIYTVRRRVQQLRRSIARV